MASCGEVRQTIAFRTRFAWASDSAAMEGRISPCVPQIECPPDSTMYQAPCREARQQHTPLAPKYSPRVWQKSRNNSFWLKPQDSEVRRASNDSKVERVRSGSS